MLGHEAADHSSPPCVKVMNEWSYTSTPPLFLHGIQKDNFILYCSVDRQCLSELTHFASGQPCVVFPSLPVYITFSIRTAFPFKPNRFSSSFRSSARLVAAPRWV